MRYPLLGLLVLLLTSGCIVIQTKYETPTTRFISPEAQGKAFKGDFSINISSTQNVQLINVGQSIFSLPRTYIVDTETSLSGRNTIGGELVLGLTEQLDFTVADSMAFSVADDKLSTTPPLFTLKYQFWGAPETAQENGWKGAVTFRYGNGTQHHETHNDQGDWFKSVLATQQSGVDLVVGYRFHPLQLAYATTYWNHVSAHGHVESNAIPTVFKNDTSSDTGILLGYRLAGRGKGVFLILERGVNRLSTGSGQKNDHADIEGLAIGYQW